MATGLDKNGLIYGVNGTVSPHPMEFTYFSLHRAPLSIHPEPLSSELSVQGSRAGALGSEVPAGKGHFEFPSLLVDMPPGVLGLLN